jgi:DNA-binding NtrC family response regulator
LDEVAVVNAVVVLFVDDDPAVLRAITRVLGPLSLEVLTAGGAEEGLAILESRPVDVVVSDIDMPGVDGFAFLERVRKEHPAAVRMLLTGAATLERALHAINEGEVSRFFTKPFNVDGFREAMAALAQRMAAARRDADEELRGQRRKGLVAWIDERYPGLLDVPRTPSDAVLIDIEEARSAAGRVGVAALFADEEPPAS